MQLSSPSITTTPTSASEVRALTTSTSSSSDTTSVAGDMQDFLQLLVVQMQNQDPLDPMDNTDFTAQLAQYSQLEQLMNINTNMTSIMESLSTDSNMDSEFLNSASFIGKQIEYSTNTLSVSSDGVTPISFYSSAASSDAYIYIYNSEGSLMGTMQYDVSKGTNAIAWDGTLNGAELPEGMYYFTVSGSDSAGDPISVSTYGEGVVEGVTMSGGVLYFQIADGLVPASSVYSIKEAATTTEEA